LHLFNLIRIMSHFLHLLGVPLASVISAYLQEAIGYAKVGVKEERAVVEVDRQPELIDALDADPEFAEAFECLTRGRQRSYVLHLAGTQNPATRLSRITKFRAKVLTGKGANER
jgi:uncharacterized protein YdeI (YjbR/CyaY-like superfamily)